MSFRFGILGPLVAKVDGRSVDLGSPKQRALLALLLMHANRVVTTDRILEELWGDDSEGKENALWVYVSRLRTLFEPDRVDRGQSSILLTRDHGYVLSVDPVSIDAVQFETDAVEGRALIKNDPRTASEILSRALQLWRGSALQDFANQEFAQPEIARLEELRLATLEDRIEADLRLGKSGELVGELEALQQRHPLRERIVSQLMLAQYRSGRQADALRSFERFRRGIGEELGIEPSPELRRLEEQVLLHDSRIQARHPAVRQTADVGPAPATNPFKGLRAFYEDDRSDFFGRDRLVADVVRRLDQGARLIGLVGPSGSGKSSVVRAGLVPALRKGAISGSDEWPIAHMVPGSHPLAELEMALLRSSLDAPDSVAEQLADPETGILRAALRVLPNDNSRLLLVIDQFEELFTLVEDEDTRTRFLDQLLPAVDDPHGRVIVVVALRADFYDRPLAYPEFGARLGDGVVNVVSLTPVELEQAARKPAELAGVPFEPALLAALLTDVVGQPGSLPLFQYTLTELFDRRVGDTLTLDAYHAMGGVKGALTGRADDLFAELDREQQAAAKQLFLRLVTIADSDEWGRRRVAGSEIVSLDVDVVALQGVVELYAAHRLLTLDRDHVTGSPTVEVAHEALLTEWDRLREWIEEGRDDVRRHASLTTAMNEWNDANRDPDYLLSGTRLEGYEQWAATATIQLTADERNYLDAAMKKRKQTGAAEDERLALETKTTRSAKRRLWGLAAAMTVLVAIGVAFVIAALAPGSTTVAALFLEDPEEDSQGQLMGTGFARAERELGVDVELLTGRFSDIEGAYRELAKTGVDLIFINCCWGFDWVEELITDHPDTAFAAIDPGFGAPNGASSTSFATEQGAYLAGIAAALTTETGVIGYVGALQWEQLERWRAGYEAGAQAVNPDIVIREIYISTNFGAFTDIAGGRSAATALYQSDADVVLAAARDASLGVIEAAWEQSQDTGIHRWAIGTDSDWWPAVADHLRPHVLTSMVKGLDVAVFETIRAFTEGRFEPGVTVLTLADKALGLAPSGAYLTDDDLATIRALSADIAAGVIAVSRVPIGDLMPPPGVEVSATVTVSWDGNECTYAGDSTTFPAGTALRFDFVNLSSQPETLSVFFETGRTMKLQAPAKPMNNNSGYVVLSPGSYSVRCFPPFGDLADSVLGARLTVEESG